MLYVRVKIHFLNVSMKNENECRNFLIVDRFSAACCC